MPYVSPTVELDTATRRTCIACRRARPFADYRLTRAGARGWVCSKCRRAKAAEQSRRTRARNAREPLPPRIELGPKPEGPTSLVIRTDCAAAVRVELARLRECGRTFEQAWPVALSVGLRDAPGSEAIWWRQTLSAQRAWWEAEYEATAVLPPLADSFA